MPENLVPGPLTAGQLRTFVAFDGAAGASVQARVQSEGVAALWHLLRTKGYGYLADEVGMGKTRQAMAVIALQLLEDANAQVVVVCPGQTLQQQWIREWDAFVRTCYRAADDRLRSTVTGQPVLPMMKHERLAEFALALQRGEGRIHLLRYSSFSRPLPIRMVGEADAQSPQEIFSVYADALAPLGATPLPQDEALLAQAEAAHDETACEQLASGLNERYATQLGHLLCARGIALAVFDEAQYLRHVGNQQNKHILRIFRPHARRWLFLSATPLHSGTQSLACLDAYLAPAPAGEVAHPCTCATQDRSPRIRQRLQPGTPESRDVVDIMKEFMVRRIRTYDDAEGGQYLKTVYRRYERVRISGGLDPFTALTMALVQKRLVRALDGQNNSFRQGECSSFESLASSLRARQSAEFERRQDAGGRRQDDPVDRSAIDSLTASFNAAAAHHGLAGPDEAHALPHAKLADVVRRVADRSLRDGSHHKTLVFVRRLDTVEELRDALLREFQQEVDRRLGVWREWLLAPPAGVELREPAWPDRQFWSTAPHAEDTEEPPDLPPGDEDDDAGDQQAGASLHYFAAIRYVKGSTPGMLHSLQARLRRLDGNPFRAFLQLRPAAVAPPDEADWADAERWWIRFVELCTGEHAVAMASPGHALHWLCGPAPDGSPASWKRATLQRCLLQSIRQTDLLVDLYVMRRYVGLQGSDVRPPPLPELLLRFLGDGEPIFPAKLAGYAANWRERFRRWIVNFDLIADKCLRTEDATEWRQVHDKAGSAFDRMQPVLGRSGRLRSENAVSQFKFPVHPNVLVCTDVLKEGVDLHLFCDEVIHYGVAWTPGDLEQRIGRVDRFGSQISRRLAAFRPSTGPHDAPRLQVEFPYLDGTLDAPQVARVILAKVRSDLRMDMGRRHEDMGKVSLDDLLDPKDAGPLEAAALPARFYPEDGVPTDPPSGMPQAPALIAPLLGQRDQGVSQGVHFPALRAVRWRGEPPASPRRAHALLRTLAVPRRRNRYTSQAEWLAREQQACAPGALDAALRSGGPVSVDALDGEHAFRFVPGWNTLTCMAAVDQPLATPRSTEQAVLLERLGGFWLLRSPLFAASERHGDAWLAAGSAALEWAYLARDDGVVWLLQFVARAPEPHDEDAFLSSLAQRLGGLAGCLRTTLGGRDQAAGSYRSRTSLPSPPAKASLFPNEREVTVVDEQWEQAGQFLGRLETWFRCVFDEVLASLGQEACRPAMTLRPDGVLHLATQGPGRVRLQAFLSGSWVVWELIATTTTTGRPPTLEASPWEQMPDLSMEGWTAGEEEADCRVYTCASDPLRYAAVYHRPHAWDGHRTSLLAVWPNALEWMQGPNFQRKALRQAFLDAVRGG